MFNKKKYTDTEIIDLIKKGNSKKVLLFLYETIQPKITNWIVQNSGDKEEAQDIFQDAILAFYQYVINDKFDINNSIEGFIYSISRNKWINRAKQKQKTVFELPLHLIDNNEPLSTENSQKINNLLTQLGEKCKELLTYSIFYKMTMDDIALRMKFNNSNTAKSKNYKCKQRLITLVKDKRHLEKLLYNE